VNYGAAILYALLVLIPIYYIFISAFKTNQQIFTAPLQLPQDWSLGKFFEAQTRVDLLKAMQVSLFLSSGSVLLTLVVGFLAAYGVARIPTRMAFFLEVFFSLGFLIPAFAILVPVFLLAARTHLLYNPIFLALFYSAARLSLTVILLAATIREIPREMEESAVCDGANLFQILWHIIFPLSRTGIATVVILNFIEIWNEYLFALVLLNQENRTLQLVIPLLRAERVTDYSIIAAGLILAILPVLLIFILFQERIMSGLYAGGVKG
jgi:multiple sugar transport system permease protein